MAAQLRADLVLTPEEKLVVMPEVQLMLRLVRAQRLGQAEPDEPPWERLARLDRRSCRYGHGAQFWRVSATGAWCTVCDSARRQVQKLQTTRKEPE